MNLYLKTRIQGMSDTYTIPVAQNATFHIYQTHLTTLLKTIDTISDDPSYSHSIYLDTHIVYLENILDPNIYLILEHYLKHLHLLPDVILNLNDSDTTTLYPTGYRHIFQQNDYHISITVTNYQIYQTIRLLKSVTNDEINIRTLTQDELIYYKVNTLLDTYINLLHKGKDHTSFNIPKLYNTSPFTLKSNHKLTDVNIDLSLVPHIFYKLDTLRTSYNYTYQTFKEYISDYINTHTDLKLITIEQDDDYYFLILDTKQYDLLSILSSIVTTINKDDIYNAHVLTNLKYDSKVSSNVYYHDDFNDITKDYNIYSIIINNLSPIDFYKLSTLF